MSSVFTKRPSTNSSSSPGTRSLESPPADSVAGISEARALKFQPEVSDGMPTLSSSRIQVRQFILYFCAAPSAARRSSKLFHHAVSRVRAIAGGMGCYQQSSRPNIVHRRESEERGFRRWTDQRMEWHVLRAVSISAAGRHGRTAYSTALRAPHELGDAPCELAPQTGWQVMSHSLDQDEFRAGNEYSRRSPTVDVAYAVSEAADHEARRAPAKGVGVPRTRLSPVPIFESTFGDDNIFGGLQAAYYHREVVPTWIRRR